MREFKVGDHVRILKDVDKSGAKYIGKVGIIDFIWDESNDGVDVAFNGFSASDNLHNTSRSGNGRQYYFDEIELCKSATIKEILDNL